ncbi:MULTISPECIES: hypothetical protein [Amycolatopsis]|uniref:Secreted protein n=1 Tax=Amycolatopsis thermalba TaxID=944492 RepID=A0ABY4NYS0_9PSEU|nr:MULTISPECIES: hypothetical protein [Amycolatopsis]OXM75171.1 hypothetical protein CF166_00855 [Amycolatopsis sp. KNN50.9b]UQS25237.1 hypothetical protein L1857_21700 [Amycolatopsis thermalba]
MNTAGKLSAYGAALVLVAGGAWAIGTAVGPVTSEAGTRGGEDAAHGDSHSGTVAETTQPALPAGLASSRGGYTLTPTHTTLTTGTTNQFAFRITGPDGNAVTAFDVEHDKRMHLIVVRRDTAGFQHLHPEMAGDGTWTVPLNVADAGSYRAFADFKPTGGQATTLGVDLAAAGDFQPRTYAPSRVAEVDGYQVRLDGDLTAGHTSKLTVTVTKDGREVTDLQPYLGAYGHLVALREGDLAYLHVHPDGSPGDGTTRPGPTVTFYAEVPSAGTYRLFLDFQHEGKVRTAEFTVATGTTPPATTQPPATADGHGHSHG